jgi:hypothetical protein
MGLTSSYLVGPLLYPVIPAPAGPQVVLAVSVQTSLPGIPEKPRGIHTTGGVTFKYLVD